MVLCKASTAWQIAWGEAAQLHNSTVLIQILQNCLAGVLLGLEFLFCKQRFFPLPNISLSIQRWL